MSLNKYMIAENLSGYGVKKLYSFPNGYGASVICNPMSYGGEEGLYEIAVIQFEIEGKSYELVYDTPVTDDVLGWVPFDDIEGYLQQIHDLPPCK